MVYNILFVLLTSITYIGTYCVLYNFRKIEKMKIRYKSQINACTISQVRLQLF